MTTKSTVTRIRPGLYEATRNVDGQPVTFTIERIERGDTNFTSDIGLWAVHVNGEPGEPAWETLRDACAYVLGNNWYHDPQWGMCAKVGP